MPRDDIRMNDAQIRRVLEEGRLIVLVTNGPRGHPHAMPMFYGLDDDLTVRFSTYENSQKVRNLERDPRVTLLVEGGEAYDELHAVMIEGHAEIVKDDLDATVSTMIEAMRRAGNEMPDAQSLPEAAKRAMAGKRVHVLIRPERFVSFDHQKLPQAKMPKGSGLGS